MKTRVSRVTNLIFSLTFCLGLASCNKEDYYQKEYLDNPFQNPTTEGPVDDNGQNGDDSGMDGGTQGGVDSGVDGGTSGSTTGSSTNGGNGSTTTDNNGGVDGSTSSGSTGGTTGGVDGTTTSGSTGGTTGGVDGSTTSGSTGGTTGGVDGSTTSGSTGGTTGGVDGSTTSGGTGGATYGDCNQGHGNDADRIDESNPTIGTDPRCKREIFHQATSTKKLDIVWIIDNSGSMSDEQDALGTNFSAFIDEFITKDVDFKMAVTTTDASSETKKGRMVYGSDVKLTSLKARENEGQFKEDFKSLVRVGTSGSGYEKGLAASEGFMQKYATSFLRPDAYLAVVILSDEEDQSAKTVTEYSDYLKSFKSEAGLIKVYSIVDTGKTNVGSYGITTGFERYAEASNNTAGIVANIRDDFHSSLSAMGDSIIKLLDSFALENAPVDGSLKVYVNGVESLNYTYDATSRSIKFDSAHVPQVGAEISVYYIKQ